MWENCRDFPCRTVTPTGHASSCSALASTPRRGPGHCTWLWTSWQSTTRQRGSTSPSPPGVSVQAGSGVTAPPPPHPTPCQGPLYLHLTGNHSLLCKKAGLEIHEYRYYDPLTKGLDFDGLIEDLRVSRHHMTSCHIT